MNSCNGCPFIKIRGFAKIMSNIKQICPKQNIYIVVVPVCNKMDEITKQALRLERVKRAREILEELQYGKEEG
jgi:hypothetical protein